MKTQMMGLALTAAALTVLTGCAAGTTASPAGTVEAGATGGLGSAAEPIGSTAAPKSSASKKPGTTTTTGTTAPAPTWTSKTSAAPSGPEIVYFKIAQKPKCAEGTAVFRAEAVPLIIKWKISHATSGALSVDDNTNTPGTYGPVALQGSEEFTFSCGGAVGTTETHKYAIYSVGGGTQRSKTLVISAKVLDTGKLVSK